MAGVDTVVDTVGYSCKVTTMRIILLVCALLTGAVQANEQTLSALRAEFAQTGALSAASAEKLRELADSGNTPAMLVLANMADAGIGVNANQKWAFDWTLRAARNATLWRSIYWANVISSAWVHRATKPRTNWMSAPCFG